MALNADSHREALDLLIRGFEVSRMIRLVADLELPDKLPKDEPCELGQLAAACRVQVQPLTRVLRALAAFEIFSIEPDGRVAHTPRSLLLRKDTPRSMHYGARFWTGPGSWQAWGQLDAALTGGVPHEAALQQGRFQYLRSHPEEARVFDAFMASFPDNRHAAVAESYDFSQARQIVDIGGGNGEALRRILGRFPQARGLVFDRPDVVAAITDEARMEGRIGTEGGSFFDAVPAGGDIYLLVRVLHDWADEDCVRILRNVRKAMTPQARLLIVEQLLDPDPRVGAATGYLVDMQMMAMFGSARERTRAEFDDVLRSAGLKSLRVIRTPSPVWINEVAVN